MKLSTKIFFVLFILTAIPGIFLSVYIYRDILIDANRIVFQPSTLSIIGLITIAINAIFGTILYVRFLRILKLSKVLFFSMTPLTIIYGLSIFIIADIGRLPQQAASVVSSALQITTQQTSLSILWASLFTLIYLGLSYITFSYVCRPIQKIERTTARLGDGKIKEDNIKIGNSNQFRKIGNSLEKINYNYKESEDVLRKTNIESEKFIPKQVLRFLGKSSISELEVGNQVQKRATTLFCDLVSSTSISKTLSLEENFNFINSYLNIISPIVRKYNGFIDQYLGDGLLAVFSKPERAVECAHSVIRAISLKNKSKKHLPDVETKIAINTGELVFGVIGEEERKSISVISDVVNLASKMEDINKFLGTKILLSKETLNSLPEKFDLTYRHVGSLKVDNEKILPLFESLDVYKKNKREKLIKLKLKFENGVRSFNNKEFTESKKLFEEILRFVNDDKPSFVYLNKAVEEINIAK